MFINLLVQLSVSTGPCSFSRPRSSSLDPFIESSFSIEPNNSSPSKTYVNRNPELDQSDESSYLVIGGGDVKKEEDYANFQSEDNGQNNGVNKSNIPTGAEKNSFMPLPANSQMRSDKPETSSNSTTFTVAPSVSSSSSAPSSSAPLSPVSMDCDLKSPGPLHDSTLSRLIDAVSLSNEHDTCDSISVLIGQFETTADQNSITALSHEHTSFHHSNLRPSTPKVLQDIRSPLKTNTACKNKTHLTSPHKVAQKTNHIKHEILSQTDAPPPAIFSSPETAELEEVYTILDEEVLSPISAYNMKKQAVHVQADTTESTPLKSLGSSPTKPVQGIRKGHNVSWEDMHRKRGGSAETEEPEESVYEEVYDPPALLPETERSTSRGYKSSSVDNNHFPFFYDSPCNTFTEVEINVDEDPLEMLTSPHGSQWEELTSPTKRHAIYQNHESTPKYHHQKPQSSYRDPPQQYPSHPSHVVYSPCPSPMNQPNYQLSSHVQHQGSSQPSPFHRATSSRPSHVSPLRQNSYPIPQNKSETFSNSRDFNSSYSQQRSFTGSQILNRSHQDRLASNLMDREQGRCFQNGFASAESLPSQSMTSTNICRDRGLYSPSSDSDAVYSHLDYDCIMTPLKPPAPRNTQPHCQSPAQTNTPKQSWNQNAHSNARYEPQLESRVSMHPNAVPSSAKPVSSTTDSTAPSPCKSKSLGDLTSEDISCNFQSKYHIISRSFITPHMRRQKRMATMGEVTLQSQSCDPLTQQLRKLVSLEADESDRERPQPPHLRPDVTPSLSQPQEMCTAPVVPRDIDDSPPLLTRRLSSRSQSRVRHINSRARERQQEALKPRAGMVINNSASIGGVVLRNKPASQNPAANRHSTGSYIAGYFGQLEDRGLPEGACTSLRYGNGDHYGDRYYTDDSLPPADSSHAVSEPEVYFLLRL